MSGCLIDTSVIIDIERGNLSWQSLENFDAFYLAAIVVSELWLGVYRARDESTAAHRQTFINGFVSRCDILPFDEAIAKTHARLNATLRRAGLMIGAHDLLIAATALQHGLPLITMNIREFKQVSELEIIGLTRK